MIPIGDNIPTERFPFVTISLIVVNLVVFVYELGLGSELAAFFAANGVVPQNVGIEAFTADPRGLSGRFVSSLFIHGGWLHLGGNMLYLWIFGDNVEDRLGPLKFLAFYLASGFLATGAHILSAPESSEAIVGASGAIAGVLGAYLVMFPGARIFILIPLLIFFPVISIPAVFALGFWFLEQVVSGTGALGDSTASVNVAWWAHIGGFLAGMVIVRFFGGRRERFRPTRYR